MPMPNYLLIGAMRSGTTALNEFLGQHPDIYVSPYKEPNYFAFAGTRAPELVEESPSITDRDEYLELFAGATGERRIGEASHSYLYYPGSAQRIRDALDDVQIVCILRHPASRAFSHFMFHVRNGSEEMPGFRAGLAAEEDRIRAGRHFGHYVNRGFYARQLKEYFEVFPRDSIRVHIYDDLASRPLWLVQDIYAFLGVDPTFEPDVSIRRNPSGVPRSGRLHDFLVRWNPVKKRVQPLLPRSLYRLATWIRDRNLIRPELDPDIRRELIEVFRADIAELERLLDRDLSGWLE
jgi:hypothetical protein